MDKKRWQEISNILDKVLTIDESDQLTFLEQNYGEDEELMNEVREILFSITESEKTSFLESASEDSKSLLKDINVEPHFDSTSGESLIGQVIGPFKIVELLARGGMGTVYKAKRTDGQFDQTVAIKFINRQSYSEITYGRFRREQKILANLKHPNIGMLLDGGISKKGFPYLIMEYIEGTRIDHYCRDNRLNIDQRLGLIKKILDAIDYAHSKLVIHRDLKPGNILVTNTGEVKILDFGIAALISEEDDANEPLTKTGQRLWTPQYAAPEQVLEKRPQLQTDIYALGSLCYKLLTGNTAFDFDKKSVYEVENMILEEVPEPMSRAVSKLDEQTVLKQFGMKKNALKKALSNDLDAIVAKCIRKEPEYRYSSVSLLLDDITRYQENLPVNAQKGDFVYRAKKFLKRNSQPIVTAALLLIVISATVIYYTSQLNQQRILAENEAAKSQQMTEFLVGIFESANPHMHGEAALGLDASIGSILDLSISRMDEDLADQPVVKASLKSTLGKMYIRLGEFERAEKLTSEAVESLSLLDTDSREELALAMYELARVHQETGNTEMADSLLLQAIDIHKRTENGLIDAQALAAVSMYANLQWFNNGDFQTADSLLSQNLEIRYEHFSDNLGNLAVGHNDLAAMYHSKGNFRDGLKHYEKAVELYETALGDHPDTGVAMGNFSIMLREYNRLEEALQMQLQSLDIHLKTSGEVTIDTGLANGNLGEIYRQKGDLDNAEYHIEKGIEILTSIYGDIHPFVGRTLLTKGNIFAERGKYEEAEELLKKVADQYKQMYPPGHGRISDPLLALGNFYLEKLDKPEEAVRYLSESYEISRDGYPEGNWRTAVVMNAYAKALIEVNEHELARELLLQSEPVLREEFGESDYRTLQAQQMLSEYSGV